MTEENQQHLPALNQRPALPEAVNSGAVAIESERAIAEAQGQLVLAKRFPRSMAAAAAEFMDACKSHEFAAKAFYAVPNRGSGPSIRFAEEVARCYGNFQYGHRELSRSDGKSEVEVFAWDMEKNNRSTRQITVMHVVDTKNGPKKLFDQADIDNRIANIASKQIRGRILALVPKHLVEAGILEVKKTIAGNNDKPLSHRVNDMVAAFGRIGVGIELIEVKLGHKVDSTNIEELTDLIGIYNSLRDGQSKIGEWFGAKEEPKTTTATLREAVLGPQKPAETVQAPPTDDPPPTSPPPPADKPKRGRPPAPTGQRPADAPPPIEPGFQPGKEPVGRPEPPPPDDDMPPVGPIEMD